jgi:sulfate adenylyltransferase subunit 1 (EFTu-like GTPase family)
VRHVIVAVNKMDLIGYDEGAFRAIEVEFSSVLDQIAADTGTPVERVFVPVSALKGDNIVHRAGHESGAMPWYTGPSLLELLESLPSSRDTRTSAFRFPVQRVLRPDHTFRGFAGQIASGTVHRGDAITVLPSNRSAKVERIVTWDGDLDEAIAPLSVTLVLDRELDISRGDLIVTSQAQAIVARSVKAAMVWMDQRPLDLSRRYLLKHASHTVPAFLSSIDYRTDLATLSREPAQSLNMNDIGAVSLNLLRPIALDLYRENRGTGAFILIDPETNATVAAGMVTAASSDVTTGIEDESSAWGPVTAGERESRWGHRGGILELAGPAALINAVERALFTVGIITSRIDAGEEAFLRHPSLLEIVTGLQTRSGLLTLVVHANESSKLIARAEGEEISVSAAESMHAVSAVHQLLHRAGIFISSEKAGL